MILCLLTGLNIWPSVDSRLGQSIYRCLKQLLCYAEQGGKFKRLACKALSTVLWFSQQRIQVIFLCILESQQIPIFKIQAEYI
jgi:hypothetical protein